MDANNLLTLLKNQSDNKGVKLNLSHIAFYVRLLGCAYSKGEECEEGLKISMSVEEMSKACEVTKTKVMEALNRLSDCGIILRYKGENSFPRHPNDTVLLWEFTGKERNDEEYTANQPESLL